MNAAVAAIGNRLGRRARAWAWRRQGIDPAHVELESRRIYILPTRAGIIFGLIVFTMLLGSMNYNNNMGIALTFLLAGIGIVSIHHCHRNLLGLVVQFRGVRPVFAGERLQFTFALSNPSAKTRWQIWLGWDGQEPICEEVPAEDGLPVTLPLPTEIRGRLQAPRIKVSTRYPLGLFRSWAWLNMDLPALVYPRPARRADLELSGDPGMQTTGRRTGGDDDFSGLRDYRTGDSPRRIAWKALARTGETLVTEYRDGAADRIWIDWDQLPPAGTEARIAMLTRLVLDAHRDQRSFGLRVPGACIEPGQGARHRHECLQCLALILPQDAPAEAG